MLVVIIVPGSTRNLWQCTSLKRNLSLFLDIFYHKFWALFELFILTCFNPIFIKLLTDIYYSIKMCPVIIVPVSMGNFRWCEALKGDLLVFYLFLLKKSELTVLICFPLNIYWNSLWSLLFELLLLLIIFLGSTRTFQERMSLEGEIYGKVLTHNPHSFSTQYSLKLLMTVIVCVIVVVNHCPSLYKNNW